MSEFGKLTIELRVFDGMDYKYIHVMKQNHMTRTDAQKLFDEIKAYNIGIEVSVYRTTWEAEAEILY